MHSEYITGITVCYFEMDYFAPCVFVFVGQVLEEVKTWRSFEREAQSWFCWKSTFSCCQYL